MSYLQSSWSACVFDITLFNSYGNKNKILIVNFKQILFMLCMLCIIRTISVYSMLRLVTRRTFTILIACYAHVGNYAFNNIFTNEPTKYMTELYFVSNM